MLVGIGEQIEEALIRAYPDVTDAMVRRLADHATIDSSHLTLTGTPRDLLYGLVSATTSNAERLKLVEAALREHPNNTDLLALRKKLNTPFMLNEQANVAFQQLAPNEGHYGTPPTSAERS